MVQDTWTFEKGHVDAFGTTEVPELRLHPIVLLLYLIHADDFDIGAPAMPTGVVDVIHLEEVFQVGTGHFEKPTMENLVADAVKPASLSSTSSVMM
jgi:hypothetical protein